LEKEIIFVISRLVSSPKQFVDLTKSASSEAIHSAKQRAIDILKQRLAQKQITPIKNQSLVSADATSPSPKRSNVDSDSNLSSKRLKISNNNNDSNDSNRFTEIMNMKSSYADLYSQMTLDEIFERYKKKENIEEKLLQIMERDIKVVVCRQCHYTAYKQSILCKVKQKFFECVECSKRVFTWSQYPVENCSKCHSLKGFRRTALIRERHGAKFEDEILLLRGEEEKFLNSFVSYEKLPSVIDE
jgi:minichromosome maintenance protein 10